jgi:predicted nucleotidyltransferase component of viral defense system
MIERTRLRDLHGEELPLHALEQDYVQALFLQELYRETDGLVFKGGTFLKHAHGLDRFSEDLDFTQVPESEGIDALESAAAALERYALPAELDDVERRADAILARLRYEGPLYDGTDRSRGTIELDVSTRDDIVRETDWIRLFFPYPETRAVTARCLSIEEAFAEKLRALGTRSLGRDLYDSWFLLQQNVSIDRECFERKMATLGEPTTVTIDISTREYERDLSVLLEHPPPYDSVLETVTDALAAAAIPFQVSPT